MPLAVKLSAFDPGDAKRRTISRNCGSTISPNCASKAAIRDAAHDAVPGEAAAGGAVAVACGAVAAAAAAVVAAAAVLGAAVFQAAEDDPAARHPAFENGTDVCLGCVSCASSSSRVLCSSSVFVDGEVPTPLALRALRAACGVTCSSFSESSPESSDCRRSNACGSENNLSRIFAFERDSALAAALSEDCDCDGPEPPLR